MYSVDQINIHKYLMDRGPFDIVGDIHGCYQELIELLIKLGYERADPIYIHPKGRKLISVGDLNDRGPQNLKVINLMMNMVNQKQAIYVWGNHCNKFYRYLLGRKVQVKHGLEYTVKEYEDMTNPEKEKLQKEYIEFYENQSYYWILDEGKLVISHAGIPQRYIGQTGKSVHDFCIYGDVNGKMDEEGHPIRKDWAKEYVGSAYVVYGHSPILEPIFLNHTIDIDQGCVFGGKLTALRYPEMELVQVESSMPKIEEQYQRMAKKSKDYKEYGGQNG